MTNTLHKPGSLVSFRGRDWMVLPSDDSDILHIKPLGGSDDETCAVYLPLNIAHDSISVADFPEPTVDNIDDFASAKLLFNASRLSFRNAAGPFRCMGKLSFRPRSYQIVPLVMALKQDPVRLLVADDVGIGKTIEALIVLREMLERGEIKRFAVICLPHLCEQWQQELLDKLDIYAEIIRSSTAASLDRKLPDDQSVFAHLPYQVISIDYIKSEKRRQLFMNDCPELVIVDEAHSCARPAGAKSVTQQQRHHLLAKIAENRTQHLLMLTATPHSGKDEEFKSLLGLLNPDFAALDFDQINKSKRQHIAKHFIQRKRENIRRWLSEDTPFPERIPREAPYKLTPDYLDFYDRILEFARKMGENDLGTQQKQLRYWTALGLLRGVMSSPAAGLEMLKNRKARQEEKILEVNWQDNPNIEKLSFDTDMSPVELMEQSDFKNQELADLKKLSNQLEKLFGHEQDAKARMATRIVQDWLDDGYSTIIFCKYIATANYMGKLFSEHFSKNVDVQTITSELPDEERRQRIQEMDSNKKHIMVATDCLSEGINLQEYFNAVMHYDLPWNPNRLEQREGRVDRFGQTSPQVKTVLLYGEDNPIDTIVLNILIKKVRDIQRATGVTIAIGEDNRSIMDAVLKQVLLDPKAVMRRQEQLALELDNDEINKADQIFTNEIDQARKKAENLRSIFAHEAVKPQEIEQELKEVDQAIGDMQSVENLVKNGIQHLGATMQWDGTGYMLHPQNLPDHLKKIFPNRQHLPISFESPTPHGYIYLGRNHRFVEQLCQFLLALAFESKNGYKRIARAAVLQTDAVSIQTMLVQFRVRNVIRQVKNKDEVIAEEMYLWGQQGSGDSAVVLSYEQAKELLLNASSTANIELPRQQDILKDNLDRLQGLHSQFIQLAENRAEELVEAHGRFKNLVGGFRFEAVKPVLPPDILGVYILVPKAKDLF